MFALDLSHLFHSFAYDEVLVEDKKTALVFCFSSSS